MASDFDNIRSNLRASEPEKSPNQLGFILTLVGVVAIGGAIGFLLLPKGSSTAAEQAEAGSAPAAQAAVQALSEAELKQMRREELLKFRETHTMLMSCARSQNHMRTVHQSYQARNIERQKAWFKLFDPTETLRKMTDMNQLEAHAYMLTRGQGDMQEIIADINTEVGASRVGIDPIKCGQLNAQVQRRELDLKPIPTT